MNINVSSFASKSFERQQKAQEKLLLNIGFISSEIHLFNPEKLNKKFYYNQPNASELNKFGWYSFKPYFLELVLNNLKDGDILIFLDVNDKPKFGIKEYIRKQFSSNKKLDILCCSTNYPNFKFMSNFHKEKLSLKLFLDSFFSFQPETGVLAIRNSLRSKSIMRIWYELTLINSYQLNKKIFINNPSRPCQETMFIISRIYKTIKFESWFKYKLTGKGLRSFIEFESLREN